MTSALLLAAYFTMLLSPCVVAEWGDVLTFRWMAAVRLRRRTHPREPWLESFRHERCNLSLLAEADFLRRNEAFETPQPFLVFRHSEPVETPAFLAARQRVAARMAQIVVAQKLRKDAAAEQEQEAPQQENIIALPADVPAAEVPAILAAAEAVSPQFAESVENLYPESQPSWEFAPANLGSSTPFYIFDHAAAAMALAHGPPHHSLAEVISITGRRSCLESHPPPGVQLLESSDASSGEVVIAA